MPSVQTSPNALTGLNAPRSLNVPSMPNARNAVLLPFRPQAMTNAGTLRSAMPASARRQRAGAPITASVSTGLTAPSVTSEPIAPTG